MKKRSVFHVAAWPVLWLACAASLSFTSLPVPVPKSDFPFNSDTIPAMTEFETGRLDAALNYLDEQVRMQSDTPWSIKTDQLQQYAANALSRVDFAKIQAAAEAAVKKIDFDQLNKEIEVAMAGIDKTKMERDLARAMGVVQNIDPAQLKLAINTALKDIGRNQLKGQLEAAGRDLKIRKQQLNAEMRQMQPGIDKGLIETRRQLQQLKDAYKEMERDGLMEKGPRNRIQFMDDELYINGEKQLPETSRKYRHYFHKRKPAAGRIIAV